jgi:PKD repeat protein
MPGTGASQITTYSWDFGDGSTGSGVRATHTYKSASTFTVVLVVVNDRGVQATTSQQVSVSPIAQPSASFVFSPGQPVVGQAVVFNADASRAAPGHTLVQFSWIYGDGSPGDTTFLATHTFQTAGTYNVTLTVMDDTGLRATASNSVIVGTGNPTATFTASNTSGHTMLFDASGTTAAVGATIAQYQWSFGDGTFGGPSTTPTITHTYGGAGAVTVRLTVTDSLGRTATFSLAVTVP